MTLPGNLEEAKALYNNFKSEWANNLEKLGVSKPPKFGTMGSMLYLYAYINLGKPFLGEDAVVFASKMLNESFRDAQILRHMSNVNGYNARGRNGKMPDGTILKSGQYALINLTETAPDWKNNRSLSVNSGDWEQVKEHYNYKCACCGSAEGHPNNRKSGTMTVLEKGHMNPKLPLGPGNMIPQCQICNKPYLDNVVFDKNGYVYALASTKLLERADEHTQKECWEFLKQRFGT